MTPLRVSVVAALVSLGLLFVVLELIRRRSLRERYALLWLLTAAVMVVLSLWRSGLDTLAGLAGIAYAPSMLFAVGAVFVVVVLLHYSTVISRLSDENAILAQRLALLEPLVERSLEPSGPAEHRDAASSVAPVASGHEHDAASSPRGAHRARTAKRRSTSSSR